MRQAAREIIVRVTSIIQSMSYENIAMKTRLTLNAFTNQLCKLATSVTLAFLLAACCGLPAAAQSVPSVELKWLGDKPPAAPMGVSWGTPWPQGKVRKDQAF